MDVLKVATLVDVSCDVETPCLTLLLELLPIGLDPDVGADTPIMPMEFCTELLVPLA